jgi:UDP-2,3-diacylglucosamine pyrophosphatase LpxH
MAGNEKFVLHLSNARDLPYTPDNKWVVFSDLHMGNGGRKDDFAGNSGLFHQTLSEFYLERGYGLILNGDVEELHKFTLKQIQSAWKTIYGLFDRFAREDRLIKTVGNHDARLILDLREHYPYRMDTVIRMTGLEFPLLIYHGHQVSAMYEKFNDISRIGVRYFALPLGIMNYSVAHDSRKRHYIERRIYDYSRRERIVSVIGHTHRPLFESLTKAESLRFRIEYLLQQYRATPAAERKKIELKIRRSRQELVEWRSGKSRPDLQSGLYEETDVPVPCLFNSGTVIGKRGITCLEFSNGRIRLVHWFDERFGDEYAGRDSRRMKTLKGGNIHRLVLRKAPLQYVMDSLRLLT